MSTTWPALAASRSLKQTPAFLRTSRRYPPTGHPNGTLLVFDYCEDQTPSGQDPEDQLIHNRTQILNRNL